ncbi:TPA: hypothetical protein ACLFOO_004631 [Yersinia enterocolitica]|uniref:hypothetical protein n=1 Tax=Yersinia TaxID=629 RepID=UPI000659C535|nr:MULTISPECIES: hypothetical protein [Yersinia]EKN3850344.1 hypothetical protein [Yersinia enterocolitica]ELI8071348.1 hypothetical protein [Yersinia enterocolitica]ELW8193695.1 hypothetical protein [Yersinia enterocolitica]CRX53843.1 Uncharacterised protein [Yersinia enterocolitica]HDL6679892.1 hypothetical protein [Yersinia enterocolitica]
MNPIQFISKNITQQLMDEGYSLPVAQGGQMKRLTYIAAPLSQLPVVVVFTTIA